MADAARIIYLRFPAVATMIGDSLQHLDRPELSSHDDSLALQAFLDSQRSLIDEGMPVIPSWHELCQGRVAPDPGPGTPESDEWRKGWQFHASNARETFFFNRLLGSLSSADAVRLRSRGGPNTSAWLTTMPTEKSLRLDDPVFRCSLLCRLGLPVSHLRTQCEGCNASLDAFGLHRSTCTRTNRLHARHKAIVGLWIKVLRESGATIRTTDANRNIERHLRDTHLPIAQTDHRRMDIVIAGLPGVFRGAPLFLDATSISPLSGVSLDRSNAASTNGDIVTRAELRNSETEYPDVERANNAQLLGIGVCLHPSVVLGRGQWAVYRSAT